MLSLCAKKLSACEVKCFCSLSQLLFKIKQSGWIVEQRRTFRRAYRGDEVGCSGSDGGPGWGGAVPESLGEEGPHDGIAGEQQASTQQPQRDVELQAGETGKQQSVRANRWVKTKWGDENSFSASRQRLSVELYRKNEKYSLLHLVMWWWWCRVLGSLMCPNKPSHLRPGAKRKGHYDKQKDMYEVSLTQSQAAASFSPASHISFR